MDRHAVGQFLRAVREKRDCSDFGFEVAGRRTPGLRRSEVAELAHISVEHYTNLEQSRGSNPSRPVLLAISDALRLDADERRHLLELADVTVPRAEAPSTEVAESLSQLVHGLRTTAALILSARYDVLDWNDLAATLLEDYAVLEGPRRNLMRRHFLDSSEPAAGRHYGMSGIVEFSRFAVGQLRSTIARYPHDPETLDLVDELLAGSAEFAGLWNQAVVTTGLHTTKHLQHATLGELSLMCDVLLVPHEDQHVVLLSAANGSSTAERIALHVESHRAPSSSAASAAR